MKKNDTLVPFTPPLLSTATPSSLASPNTLRSSIHPASRLSPRIDPIDQSESIRESDRFIGSIAGGKLHVIREQINALQNLAKNIIVEAEKNMLLHRASCSFEKRVGHTYFLYDRSEDDLYFSILSPEDWRGRPPHKFIGTFRLEHDATWSDVTDQHQEG